MRIQKNIFGNKVSPNGLNKCNSHLIIALSMSKQRNLLEIHLATLLFGLAGLFGKWLALSPFFIVLGRVLFASLALWLIISFTSQSLKAQTRSEYFLFLLLGLILAVHWAAFFRAIQVSTVAVGLLSYSSFPVFTAFLEPLFLKEKMDRTNILFAILCLCGVFLIIPRLDLANSVSQGVLWGLLSGFTFAVLTIFNRKLIQKYSSLMIAFYEDMSATFFLLPFLFLTPLVLHAKDIFLLVILGVICTAGAHSLFIHGMRRVRAQTASIISSLEPVYGIVFALFLLREIPSVRTILGGIIILSATFSVSLREGRTPQEKS